MELSIEERIARLEGALGWAGAKSVLLRERSFWLALSFLVGALLVGLRGFGLPNHHYQIVFAILTVALCYHQGWLATPTKRFHWLLALLNTAALSLIIKLLIGLGEKQPMFWAKLPAVAAGGEPTDKWIQMPHWQLRWEETALSGWNVDLTIVQTFLFLLTLLAALFEFQPFASLTAFLLIILSLPALLTFSWDYVFWAIIFTGIGFYLQLADTNREAA